MSEGERRALVEELHKPARRRFPRRHVDIRDLDDTWQADLVDMSTYTDKGHHFLLTVIDTFSKYAWAIPTKTKSGKIVTATMRVVLEQGRQPKRLQVDMGKEFYNATFKKLMDEYGVRLYSTYSNLKASICERFNRTLKTLMWKEFSLRGSYKWIDLVTDLVSSYNVTKYRTIGMKPADVTSASAPQLKLRYAKIGCPMNASAP